MSAKTSISARIDRMVDSANSKVKAVASVTIGGAFAVHGIKVIDSQKGLFVQMPQSSYEKGGQKHRRWSRWRQPLLCCWKNQTCGRFLLKYWSLQTL